MHGLVWLVLLSWRVASPLAVTGPRQLPIRASPATCTGLPHLQWSVKEGKFDIFFLKVKLSFFLNKNLILLYFIITNLHTLLISYWDEYSNLRVAYAGNLECTLVPCKYKKASGQGKIISFFHFSNISRGIGFFLNKLEGEAPLITDPPPTSSTTMTKFSLRDNFFKFFFK